MTGTRDQTGDPRRPAVFTLRIKGHLDQRWSEWFEGMTIEPGDGGETRLTGPVIDQAALHGLLNKIRDLGLPLIAVTRDESEPGDRES